MGLIGIIIVELIVGLVVRFLKSGDDNMGWIMTAPLGVGGSLLAIYGGQAISFYRAGQAADFISAMVGTAVLLVIYGLIKRN